MPTCFCCAKPPGRETGGGDCSHRSTSRLSPGRGSSRNTLSHFGHPIAARCSRSSLAGTTSLIPRVSRFAA
eukprot:4886081-Alexandrium_andersonii.AAC.1